MIEAALILVGVLVGAFAGLRVWGGRGTKPGAEEETCLYFCPDGTTKEGTCKTGESGKCLQDLADDCFPKEPNV